MFFMTRNRFEEEVGKRVAEWQRREEHERVLGHVYSTFCKLEERIARLEGKAGIGFTAEDGCPVRVAQEG